MLANGAWCMVHGAWADVENRFAALPLLLTPTHQTPKPVNSQLIKLTKLIKFVKLYIPFLSRQNVLQTVDFTGPR